MAADQDSVSVAGFHSLLADFRPADRRQACGPGAVGSDQAHLWKSSSLRKTARPKILLVGDDTPTGGGDVREAEDDPRVFSVASGVKSSLDKTTKDLRDKRLLTFDSDKLTRVELQAKGQTFEFGKNNQNEWQILKPKPLRADGSQVEELMRKLKDAKMDTVGLRRRRQEGCGGVRRRHQGGGRHGGRLRAATQTIEVREGQGQRQVYYAKSSAVEGIYKVANDLGDGLDKELDDFRNKKLFDFGLQDPTKLRSATTTYRRAATSGSRGGKQMDSSFGAEPDRQAARHGGDEISGRGRPAHRS